MPLATLSSPQTTRPWWIWPLIFSPAIFLLFQMAPLLVALPNWDAWSFVQQYREIIEDRYSWEAFFAPNYAHPSATGKSIYFAVLHFFGGNVGLVLPIMSWLFSTIIALSVYRLARPLWAEGKWLTAVVLFTATSIIFTAAQGETWLWDFVFQNFIPGTFLGITLWMLLTGSFSTWKLVLAAVLCVLSTHSFATGFLVPTLLVIPIWQGLRDKSTSYKLVFSAIWLAIHGAIAIHALTAPGGSDKGQDVGMGTLIDRPFMRLHFLCILLGNILGKGTVYEPETLCAIFGGTLLLIFLASAFYVWRHKNDRALWDTALPWLLFALYGLGSAGLISIGRMQQSLDNALEERFGTFTVFFSFGTLLLAFTVLRKMAASGSSAWYPLMRRAAIPVFAVFAFALLINWGFGLDLLRLKHTRMEQERALLAFAKVMPLENPEWMLPRITRKSSFTLSVFLADRGLLKDVTFAESRSLDQFKKGKNAVAKWTRFDAPQEIGKGRWLLSGMGGLAIDNVADLILITAQGANTPEEIVGLTATLMPRNFFERQKEVRYNPEYYLGWKHTLSEATLPPGPITLRAYVFDQDKRIVSPIQGEHRLREADKPSIPGAS